MPTICQPALALLEQVVSQEALIEALGSRSQREMGPGLRQERLITTSRESLREQGKLSSVSILDVLERMFRAPCVPEQDALGLLVAFGPGSTRERQVS